jgi:hypothetical protein
MSREEACLLIYAAAAACLSLVFGGLLAFTDDGAIALIAIASFLAAAAVVHLAHLQRQYDLALARWREAELNDPEAG